MSLFVEDNNFIDEIKRQLRLVASVGQASQSLIFMPSETVPEGRQAHGRTDETKIKYSRVKYPVPTSQSDLGSLLVTKLANHATRHTFIHGLSSHFPIILKPATFDEVTTSVRNHGGGFTTDVDISPHIDVYVDADPEKDEYRIWTTQRLAWAGGWGTHDSLPYVRLYHELVHADRLMMGLPHGEKTMVPLTNAFRNQRNVGYERAVPWRN